MSNIIQVTNIAATATEENMKTLFSFVGPIREMIMYFENAQQEETKVGYVVFESNSDAETALHLHNTVFHDRALIVLPLADSCKGQIPDLSYATIIRAPEKTVTGITPKNKNWPSDVLSMVVGRTGEQSIVTIEPNFTKQELPNYPNLPYSTEVAKIDEIRRTVLITNLEADATPQQVLDFFQPVAEVKFIRMAGSEQDNAAYVEFTEQGSVSKAFGMMGSKLNNRPVMIQHSNAAITKPSSNHRSGADDSNRRIRAKSTSRSRSAKAKSRSKKKSRSPRKSSKSRRRSRSSRRRSGSVRRSRRKSGSRSRRRSRSHRRSRSRKGSKRRSLSRSRRGSKPRSSRRSRSRHRRDKRRSVSKPKERKSRRSGSRERNRKEERSRSRHGRPKRNNESSRSRDRSSRDRKAKKERDNNIDRPKERRHKSDRAAKEDRKRRHSSTENNNSVKADNVKVTSEKMSTKRDDSSAEAPADRNGDNDDRQRSSSEETRMRAALVASLNARSKVKAEAAAVVNHSDVDV